MRTKAKIQAFKKIQHGTAILWEEVTLPEDVANKGSAQKALAETLPAGEYRFVWPCYEGTVQEVATTKRIVS